MQPSVPSHFIILWRRNFSHCRIDFSSVNSGCIVSVYYKYVNPLYYSLNSFDFSLKSETILILMLTSINTIIILRVTYQSILFDPNC